MRARGNPAKQGWDPIRVGAVNTQTPMAHAFVATEGRRHHYVYREPQRAVECVAFGNRLYDGLALTFEDGSMHLSFKRKDRAAVRDWRHFQAIKNEVAGPEREGIEIYPPESELVDAANEYHLWILPPDARLPVGFAVEGPQLLPAADEMDYAAYRTGGRPGGRQRGWEDGIPTGLGRSAA